MTARLKRPPLTSAQRERIAELREKRWNIPGIAAEIGCSEGSVSWSLLRQGIDIHEDQPLPPVPTEPVIQRRGDHLVRRFTQAEDARLLALEAKGLNPYQIGKAMGRQHNSIIGRLATLARREARQEAA